MRLIRVRGSLSKSRPRPFLRLPAPPTALRSTLDARAYRGTERLTFAGRAQLGALVGPVADRKARPFIGFYSGGGGTVRGQDYQSLGVDLGGLSTGGRSLLALSGELARRFNDTATSWPLPIGAMSGRRAFPTSRATATRAPAWAALQDRRWGQSGWTWQRRFRAIPMLRILYLRRHWAGLSDARRLDGPMSCACLCFLQSAQTTNRGSLTACSARTEPTYGRRTGLAFGTVDRGSAVRRRARCDRDRV